MLQNIPVTIAGNLTADPELRFTTTGKAVCSFTVAQTPRVKAGNEWKDGTATFVRCELWGPAAENMAESLTRGARVLVAGELRTEEWQDKETNEPRRAVKLIVSEVGASLQYATVKVQRAGRRGAEGPAPVDPWSGEAASETTPAAVKGGE